MKRLVAHPAARKEIPTLMQRGLRGWSRKLLRCSDPDRLRTYRGSRVSRTDTGVRRTSVAAVGSDGHPADRIAVIGRGMLAVVVSAVSDVCAATEAHHDEEQQCEQKKAAQPTHGLSPEASAHPAAAAW